MVRRSTRESSSPCLGRLLASLAAKGKESLRSEEMLEKTWIGATGQRWKAYVIFGLLAVTVAWLAVTIAFLDRPPSDLGALALLVLFLMIVGCISWTFWSLSCPSVVTA